MDRTIFKVHYPGGRALNLGKLRATPRENLRSLFGQSAAGFSDIALIATTLKPFMINQAAITIS